MHERRGSCRARPEQIAHLSAVELEERQGDGSGGRVWPGEDALQRANDDPGVITSAEQRMGLARAGDAVREEECALACLHGAEQRRAGAVEHVLLAAFRSKHTGKLEDIFAIALAVRT